MTLKNSTLSIGELHNWTVGKHVETNSSGLCVLDYNTYHSFGHVCFFWPSYPRETIKRHGGPSENQLPWLPRRLDNILHDKKILPLSPALE